MNNDLSNLRLLAIFHYVVGGLIYLFSLFPLIHVIVGLIFIVSPEQMIGEGEEAPPQFFGWIFLIMGSAFILIGFTFATFIVISGRKLSKKINYWFSFIVACIECMFMPFGTVLGIFTIIILSKDSIKELYGIKKASISMVGNMDYNLPQE